MSGSGQNWRDVWEPEPCGGKGPAPEESLAPRPMWKGSLGHYADSTGRTFFSSGNWDPCPCSAPSDATAQAIKSPSPANPGVTTKQGSRSYFSPVGHAGNSSHFTHLNRVPLPRHSEPLKLAFWCVWYRYAKKRERSRLHPLATAPGPTCRPTRVRICSAVQGKPAGGHHRGCPAVVPCPAPPPPQGEPSLCWFQFRLEKKKKNTRYSGLL